MKAKALEKQLVFKFAALRPPQEAEPEIRSLYFITDNDKSNSFFLKNLSPNQPFKARRTHLKNKATAFNPDYKNLISLKSSFSKLYNLGYWLDLHRDTMTSNEVNAKIAGVNSLTKSQRRKLWDNLYYQLLTRTSDYVRNGIITLLLADHFIGVYKPSMKDFEIRRLAASSVLIDQVFITQNSTAKPHGIDDKSLRDIIERILSAERIKQNFQNISLIYNQLIKLKEQYDNDYKKAFRLALNNHQTQVKNLLTNTILTQYKTEQWKEVTQAVDKGRLPLQIPLNVHFPPFTFTFPSIFSTQYLNKLNIETQQWLTDKGVSEQTSFDEVIQKLEEEKGALFASLQHHNGRRSLKVLIGDSAVDLLTVPFPSGTVGIYITKNSNTGPSVTYDLYLAVLWKEGLDVTSQSHTVDVNNKKTKITESVFIGNRDGLNLYRLIKSSQDNLLSGARIEGQFIFSDGTGFYYQFENIESHFQSSIGTFKIPNGDPVNEIKMMPGVYPLGIIDLMKVEQEVCCYLPGDVSHIENIMAREYKERSTRTLLRSEITEEQMREDQFEEQKDTVSTERFLMQREVEEVLQQHRQLNSGVAFNSSSSVSASGSILKGIGVQAGFHSNLNTYADMSLSTSRTRSNRISTEFAKEVTEQATLRVMTRTVSRRTSKIIREFEEHNKHGFDNRKGNQNVTSVFRWLDIVYKHKLYNYGKHLIYEFAIPEPSRHFMWSLYQKAINDKDCQFKVLEKPLHPSELPSGLRILSSNDINAYNYSLLASYYETEVDAPPEAYLTTGITFEKSQISDGAGSEQNKSMSKQVEVPKGYVADSARLSYDVKRDLEHSDSIVGYVVGHFRGYSNQDHQQLQIPDIGAYTDKVPVGVYFNWIWAGIVNVEIRFKRTETLYREWQQKVYLKLLEAYETRLQWYEEQLQTQCEKSKEVISEQTQVPSSFYRQIERRELKRAAVELMTLPFDNPLSYDHFNLSPQGGYYIRQDEALDYHARIVKFFEEAFDWNLMDYTFYPYYWADRNRWVELMNRNNTTDPLFGAFLQSGMARLRVPVRPGYEEAVMYYMKTGDVWTAGKLIIEDENDYYISVADDIKQDKPELIAEWFNRVPTTLTLIQSDTIALNTAGLPCCGEIQFETTNPVESKTGNLLENDCNTGSSNTPSVPPAPL